MEILWTNDAPAIDKYLQRIQGKKMINHELNGFTSLFYSSHYISTDAKTMDEKYLQTAQGKRMINRELDGLTSLIYASYNNFTDVADVLLSYGADVNIVCKFGFTALCCACENGHIDIVNRLLASGANANIGNKLRLPIFAAIREGYFDIIKMLTPCVNFTLTNDKEETVLFDAIRARRDDIFDYIFDYCSDINHVNVDGKTCLDVAKYYQYTHAIEIFSGIAQ